MTDNIEKTYKLATELRDLNINTEVYLNDKKLKAKVKYADKLEIPYIIVIGDNEIEEGKVKVKNMETGEEIETLLDAKEILKIIKNN